MDRDEVLEKSRMENRHGDERDRGIAIESGTWGAVSLAAATAVVYLMRLLSKGGPPVRLARHPLRIPRSGECLQMEQGEVRMDAPGDRAVQRTCPRMAVRLRRRGLMRR